MKTIHSKSINLPEIISYNPNQINEFTEFSPAGKIYLDLLKNAHLDIIYKIRHEAWLKTALANFHSQSDQQTRSAFWSKAMDSIVIHAFEKFFDVNDEILVLALGKYGSEVLNLSSDIDIILIADAPITAEYLKKARSFMQLLNAKTPHGFLTRVDLNLKPTDVSGPIVTASHLTSYLWNSNELWERLVYTRARKVCGQLKEEQDLFSEINKFCFRKYIRMDLVAGLSELLQKILNNNSDENNIKLCLGGIRTIELMLAAIQLLYAGRVSEFKSPKTYNILQALDKIRIFSDSQIFQLENNYNILRSAEDRIQSVLDEQTHSVHSTADIKSAMSENLKNLKIFLATIANTTSVVKSTLIEKLKELALKHFHLNDFVAFLIKHPSYIGLFETHPKSYDNLLKSLIYSPQVTRIILLRPDLMDMFLLKKTNFEADDTDEELLIKLSDFKSISQITAIGEFLTEYDLPKLLLRSSKTADFCVEKILAKVFVNESVDILKLGKWSSNELGIYSDLDFVITYEGSNELSRLARKFISYLTHGTFHGPFYNIDLRLRPSGNAGPILTNNLKLKTFLEGNAPVWLKQAYLRTNYLKTKADFNFNISVLNPSERLELLDIRTKRFTEPTINSIHLKDNFGGIVDIEFLIQCLFLNANKHPVAKTIEAQIKELSTFNLLNVQDADLICNSYQFLRFLEQISEILFKSSLITPLQFHKILELPNINEKLNGIKTFYALFLYLQDSQAMIAKLHPFK